MAELTSYIGKNQDQLGNKKRMLWVMRRVSQDVMEELKEADPVVMSLYMEYMGAVISWIGHGDDDKLPDSVKEFLQARAGTEEVTGDGIDPELSPANTTAG